jgi:hypothetical protein
MRRFLLPLGGLALLASVAVAQTPETRPTGFPDRCRPGEVQVMLLGTYHFANPGRDAVKQDIDDVLASHRQQEIEDLVQRLARWEPDQIAVEWPFSFADSTQARYERFRNGTLPPNRNEVVQVGFRLAAKLGHPSVHPIDHQMPIGNDSIAAVVKRRPEFQRAGDSLTRAMQARADSEAPLMRRTTIVEHLYLANTDDELHGRNSLGMFGTLLPVGEGQNYGGPQILAKWYERNIYMVHNIMRVLRPGTDRVLVIVGSGQVPPMRNVLDESPHFCPVSPLPYLR